MVYKLWVFLGVENIMLILQYAINYNLLPQWFNEERDLKELYDKKYLKKKGSLLPHNFLIVKKNKIELKMKNKKLGGTLISNLEGVYQKNNVLYNPNDIQNDNNENDVEIEIEKNDVENNLNDEKNINLKDEENENLI